MLGAPVVDILPNNPPSRRGGGLVRRFAAHAGADLLPIVVAVMRFSSGIPFVFDLGTVATWNDVIVGALVTSFGGYNGYTGGSQDKPETQPA